MWHNIHYYQYANKAVCLVQVITESQLGQQGKRTDKKNQRKQAVKKKPKASKSQMNLLSMRCLLKCVNSSHTASLKQFHSSTELFLNIYNDGPCFKKNLISICAKIEVIVNLMQSSLCSI